MQRKSVLQFGCVQGWLFHLRGLLRKRSSQSGERLPDLPDDLRHDLLDCQSQRRELCYRPGVQRRYLSKRLLD